MKEDYVFGEQVDDKSQSVCFAELFGPGKDTLFLYNFMYSPDMQAACPTCATFLDGVHGQIEHPDQRINVAVVARQSIDKIHEFATSRHWDRFRLLCSGSNTYSIDCFGGTDSG